MDLSFFQSFLCDLDCKGLSKKQHLEELNLNEILQIVINIRDMYHVSIYFINLGLKRFGLSLELLAKSCYHDRSILIKIDRDDLIIIIKLIEEASITAFYLGGRTQDLIINLIETIKFIPKELRISKNIMRNQSFYVKQLDYDTTYEIVIPKQDLPLIRGTSKRFNTLNPSILREEQFYLVIIRTVNYYKPGYTKFEMLDKKIITKNFLVQLDSNFKIIKKAQIIDMPRKTFDTIFEGFEDCRLFKDDNGNYFFTCTNGNFDKEESLKIALVKLPSHLPDFKDNTDVMVEKVTILPSPKNEPKDLVEKNWLPFYQDGTFKAIYNYNPYTIIKMNSHQELINNKGTIEIISERKLFNIEFDIFRGSAGPIPFQSGHLIIVHEVNMKDEENYYYFHYFVYLSGKSKKIKRISQPFFFLKMGVEFCSGLCYHHNKSDLVITIGFDDREAHLFTISTKKVEKMLLPIPSWLQKKDQ